MKDYTAVVLDIEGTTTAISFVYDVLFPFARREMASFLETHFDDPAVQSDLALIGGDATRSAAHAAAAAIALMDGDVKDTGLKGLQGRIWRDGYARGELKGHVFDDVPAALAAWRAEGLPVYIYSSGSVAAQKLLFGQSIAGDLTALLEGYFDTTTGPKKEASSYTAIAAAIGRPAAEVLFITDNLDEAIAARQAGFAAMIALRPGNHPLPEHDFGVVESLTSLL